MNDRYSHLLYRQHHRSVKHKPMRNIERAAQFAAFQALTGYEENIAETARFVDARHALTEDEQTALNQAFCQLQRQQQSLITVTYFVPDGRKAGGAYVRRTGRFRFLDLELQQLKLTDGTAICLGDICRMELQSTAQ